MQLPLLVAPASPPAGAPGCPATTGSDGSGFGAVLTDVLSDQAAGAPLGRPAELTIGGTPPGAQPFEGARAFQAAALPESEALQAAPGSTEEPGEASGLSGSGDVTLAESPTAVPGFVGALTVPAPSQVLLTAQASTPLLAASANDAAVPEGFPGGSLSLAGTAGSAGAAPHAGEGPEEPMPNASPAVAAGTSSAAASPAPEANMAMAAGTPPASNAAVLPTAAPSASPALAATPARAASPSSSATPAGEAVDTPATEPVQTAGFPPVLPAPVQGTPGMQQAAAPAPPPVPFADPGRLTPQLASPLFSLASAAPGQHVMTLKVSPEDLGPLTVRAHIDAAGMRIELFAPAEAGRDALRTILPELRRGLAESGLAANLDLSEHGAPPDSGAGEPGQDRGGRERSQPPPPAAAATGPVRGPYRHPAVVLPGSTPGVLDILV